MSSNKKNDGFNPVKMMELMYQLMDTEIWKYSNREEKLVLPFFQESAVERLIVEVGKIFKRQPTLLSIQSPVIVVGDLHGNLIDLLTILKNNGAPPWTKYLFLGDMVDRGQFSLETVVFIYLMVYNFPKDVFVIRGNHEVRAMCAQFGFKNELMQKYNSLDLFKTFTNTFDQTPFGALIDTRILCMHGGIGPHVKSLRSIAKTKRPLSKINKKYASYDLLWSDPFENAVEYENSPRGYGYLFGKKHIIEFEKRNNLSIIIRGHEMATNGVNFDFDGHIVTVFSASNYCNLGNDGGVLQIEPGCHVTAHTYRPSGRVLRADEVDYMTVILETTKIPRGIAFILRRQKKQSPQDDDVFSEFLDKLKPKTGELTFFVPNQFVLSKHAREKQKRLKAYLEREQKKKQTAHQLSQQQSAELNAVPPIQSPPSPRLMVKPKRVSRSVISDPRRVVQTPVNTEFPDSAASLPRRVKKKKARVPVKEEQATHEEVMQHSDSESEDHIQVYSDNELDGLKCPTETEPFSSSKRAESVRGARRIMRQKRRESPTPFMAGDVATKFMAAQTKKKINVVKEGPIQPPSASENVIETKQQDVEATQATEIEPMKPESEKSEQQVPISPEKKRRKKRIKVIHIPDAATESPSPELTPQTNESEIVGEKIQEQQAKENETSMQKEQVNDVDNGAHSESDQYENLIFDEGQLSGKGVIPPMRLLVAEVSTTDSDMQSD